MSEPLRMLPQPPGVDLVPLPSEIADVLRRIMDCHSTGHLALHFKEGMLASVEEEYSRTETPPRIGAEPVRIVERRTWRIGERRGGERRAPR